MNELILKISFSISLIILAIAALLIFTRIIFNKTTARRVLALDLLTSFAITATALFSVWKNNSIYLDSILAFIFVTFLGTVAYAQYIGSKERGGHHGL